jgi:hypothetical protein
MRRRWLVPGLLIGLALSLGWPWSASANHACTGFSPREASTAFNGVTAVTVTGSGFTPASVVRQGFQNRPTTFVDSTRLTATLASDAGGLFTISVLNGSEPVTQREAECPGQGFTVLNPIPTISRITVGASPVPPAPLFAGRQETITVEGANFVNGVVLLVNGGVHDAEPTVLSGTRLAATLNGPSIDPSARLATAGPTELIIQNPSPGTNSSAPVTVSAVATPAPTCTALSPASATIGSAQLTLTVTGNNFAQDSRVRWNGSDRATTFVSRTELRATIPAADVVAGGNASVTVFTPAPGGGTCQPGLGFSVVGGTRPAPQLTALFPNAVPPASGNTQIVLSGGNFFSDSVVFWQRGAAAAANLMQLVADATQAASGRLLATVPASELVSPGAVTVFVVTPNAGVSNALSFTIGAGIAITSVSPSAVVAGSPPFVLTVDGAGFSSTSTVRVNGASRPTTFVGPGRLTAAIGAADVATAAALSVSVSTGPTNSNLVTVTVTNPSPTITSLAPTTCEVGRECVVRVRGAGFVPGSVARLSGAARPTAFVSAAELALTLPASDLAAPGSAAITVVNPSPGGGTSPAASLGIVNARPVLTGINPTSTVAGSGAITLGITGNSFAAGSVVQVAGTPLPTSFLNSRNLSATVPPSMLAVPRTLDVRISNPAPGGGVSEVALTLQVTPPTLAAAVLPGSRSVQVGATATAFATIINLARSAQQGCTIAPAATPPVPATFVYRTTDPETNAPTGAPNTPVAIGPERPQSFVIAFTPTAAFPPTEVPLTFSCGDAVAPSTPGLNTLLLGASAAPSPDIVALAATPSLDGIVTVAGTAAFAVATVNVGASGTVTVSADTGDAGLPLSVTICRTNEAAQCLGAPAPTVPATINAGATAAFSVFVRATGPIAFLPSAHRVFVRFVDGAGVTRGATSVAVRAP